MPWPTCNRTAAVTDLTQFFPFFFAYVILHFSFPIGSNCCSKEEGEERERSELRDSGKSLLSEGDD